MNLWESFVNWIPLSLPLLFVFVTTGPFSYRCSVACLRLPCVSVTRRQHLQLSRDIWEGNSLQCVDESPSCWFPQCAQSCRKGKPEKGPSDWQMGKDLPHFIVCYFQNRPPPHPCSSDSITSCSPLSWHRERCWVFLPSIRGNLTGCP